MNALMWIHVAAGRGRARPQSDPAREAHEGILFLSQQDVLPSAARGSPILFVLAFAPFAAMAYWLARLRFAKWSER